MPAFLLNPSGIFVVNPVVTGYTPTASEVEWPGSASSLMTIDKVEALQGASPPGDVAPAEVAVVAEEAPVVEVETAAATDGDEYYVHQTGTRNPDNDADGVLDGDEVANGTEPNDPYSF